MQREIAKILLIASLSFIIFAPLFTFLILINSPLMGTLIDVNLVLFGSITYAVIISMSLLYQLWKKKAAHAKRGGDLEC